MIKRFVLVALFIGVLLAVLWQTSKSRTFQFFGEIVPRVSTTEKVVALTFDDGPSAGPTDEILAILAAENVKATFFVIGGELEQNPAEGKKIVAAGHELGNHSYSHERMLLSSPATVKQEIESTDGLIRSVGYQGEIFFRPPYTKKLFTLPYYLSKTNRKTITFDVEPETYPEIAATAEKITEHVLTTTQPGSIILLHVMYGSRNESRKSVKPIIEGLKAKGYSFKTVAELLATGK